MSDPQIRAQDGVANPMKFSLWRVSILNFASLRPLNTAIRRGRYTRKLASAWKRYMIMAGATPNVTISARESSSFPIGE